MGVKPWDETDTRLARLTAGVTALGLVGGFPAFLWWADGIMWGLMLARWLLTRPDR